MLNKLVSNKTVIFTIFTRPHHQIVNKDICLSLHSPRRQITASSQCD